MTQDLAAPSSPTTKAPAAPPEPHAKAAHAAAPIAAQAIIAPKTTPAKPDDHPALEASEVARKKHRSTGNRVFDLVVYPVIAFGVVLVASMKALNYMKYGGGRVGFERWAHKTADQLGKWTPFKNTAHETLYHAANNTGKVLASFAVGTVLMVPIKLLEDKRTQISAWFDKVLGSEPRKENEIKEEPKQSWKSVLGGRAITFASVLGLSFLIGDKRTKFVENQVADRFTGALAGAFPEISKERLPGIKESTRNLTFELFYTALCATLVYTLSRIIARKDDEKKHLKESPITTTKPTAAPKDAEQVLAGIAPHEAESTEPKLAAHALRRDPQTYGVRQEKPADFRTKYSERKSQETAAMVSV